MILWEDQARAKGHLFKTKRVYRQAGQFDWLIDDSPVFYIHCFGESINHESFCEEKDEAIFMELWYIPHSEAGMHCFQVQGVEQREYN